MEKKNLLLLHGAMGSQDQWSLLAGQLENDFTVFRFNFSGHGGSPVPDSFSVQSFAREVIAFLSERSLSNVYVLGYSMGGYVAIQVALIRPDLVQRVMTLGTLFAWSPETAAREVRMMNPEVIRQKVPAFAEALQQRHAPEDWMKLMQVTAAMMIRMGNGEALAKDDFQQIKIPVLLCVGSADHMVSRAETERTATWLPNGTSTILEGFRHPLESADNRVLCDLIKSFFP